MTEKWLICTDLDGTLLRKDASVSPYSIDVFQRMHQMGHEIILASGRHWDHMTFVADALDIPVHIVASNGAWVGDASGRATIQQTVDLGIVTELETLLQDIPAVIIATLDKERVVLSSGHPDVLKQLTWPVALLGDIRSAPVFKLTVMMQRGLIDDVLPQLEAQLGTRIQLARTDERTIDMNAQGVSKGQAIAELGQKMGIPQACWMAFGNEMNDTEMLRMAHIGVAVADANPDLFPYANLRAGTSEEDGVAAFLDQYFT